MSPTSADTSLCEAEAYLPLLAYAQTEGGRAFAPSAGFAIGPGHAVASPSDVFAETVANIERYIECGSQYGVAIDPLSRRVEERGTPPAGLALFCDAVVDARS